MNADIAKALMYNQHPDQETEHDPWPKIPSCLFLLTVLHSLTSNKVSQFYFFVNIYKGEPYNMWTFMSGFFCPVIIFMRLLCFMNFLDPCFKPIPFFLPGSSIFGEFQ